MPTISRYYSSTAAKTTLASPISSSATSLQLAAAANLPTQYPFTLILEKDTANEEVIEITGLVGTSYTIGTRGVDGSGAKAHAIGALVEHGVSARDFAESRSHEASTSAHGVTGDIVGTGGSQTLTSKTLTSPIISGSPVITGLSSAGMVDSSAAPKNYVDSILGSATAASTSAASAATSAASALTSQTSAATSASSALTSQTSAATSASSALTSQTSAATSASSALTSQTSAATSASSALTSQSSAATSATSAANSATTAAASVATISGFATTATNSASAASTSAASAATSAASAATSASTMAASVTAAATSAASAATSATSAANSATAAAASAATATTSAATAISSAATAVTSAATAISSAATATTSAAQAATSATSALTSQTSAATSASSAAASATASATSASIALTSASVATSSAATAVTSAAQAATSATSAATSASYAATSATSAQTSASSAATTYTAYDNRYLGSKTSAPTVDNYGGVLLVGATYWNSNLNTMYAWSGSTWNAISSTTSYSAPTIGSTTIASGTTYGTITGLTLSGGSATADPTTALGLATKQYVDAVTTAINFHAPVIAASTTNLATTYSNGTGGVGATLTADTNRAFNTLDGATVSVGGRVLIKNQTNQAQNGIYTLTNNGSVSTPWVLTRATDNDNNPAGEIANGDIVFVQAGTLNIGKTYVNASAVGSITVGTTNIVWSEFTASLPPQSGNAGKFLTTDGTAPSWVTVDAAPQIMMLMGA
jgi:hypothetical protein